MHIILFPKELLVRWATDVYEFAESQVTATVELVTDSRFEVGQVRIQGFPRQIPDGDSNRFPSLVVPGPSLPGAGQTAFIVHTAHIKHLKSNFFFQVYTHLRMSLSLFPLNKGFAFDATIERVFVRVPAPLLGDSIFGNAQVTRKILRIDHMKEPKLICCLHLFMQSLVTVML